LASAEFRNVEAGASFSRLYDQMMTRWPLDTTRLDVPGHFGSTHVQRCGRAGAPPALLLHGGGSSSPVWYALANALTADFEVFAPDRIGTAGRSKTGSMTMSQPHDLVRWVVELLDVLGLPTATLVGHSYGAWIALIAARDHPERVDRLVLLDPTNCFAGLSIGYLMHAVPLLARPSDRTLRSFLRWETGGVGLDPLTTDFLAAIAAARYDGTKLVSPVRLRTVIATPTLLFLAGRSRAHNINTVASEALQKLPNLRTETLPNAAHHTLPIADATAVATGMRTS
jgi:pimeloyl-ACP methyl ester carboxylesterase